MEAGIADVYDRLGVRDVPPRFSMALIFVDEGDMTIRELAREVDVTHSAMSQTVSAMRAAGPNWSNRQPVTAVASRAGEPVRTVAARHSCMRAGTS